VVTLGLVFGSALIFVVMSLALQKPLFTACPRCEGRNFDYIGYDWFECVNCHHKLQFPRLDIQVVADDKSTTALAMSKSSLQSDRSTTLG